MKQTAEQKQQEQFKARVLEIELNARYNKAEYERMYYYLQARDITDAFLTALSEDRETRAKNDKMLEAYVKGEVDEQNNPIVKDEFGNTEQEPTESPVETAKIISL